MAKAIIEQYISNPTTVTFQVRYFPDIGESFVQNIDIGKTEELSRQRIFSLIKEKLIEIDTLQSSGKALSTEIVNKIIVPEQDDFVGEEIE